MHSILKLHIDNIAREKRPVNIVKNETGASLYIYDVISADWGVSAQSVIDALAQVEGAPDLDVFINTPGGDVFEARAIKAALNRYAGKTIAHIDALCASAGTSIALACSEVRMSDGALFMVHNASGGCWGDKTAMRTRADLLQKVELDIIKDYTSKTGKDDTEVIVLMDAETWMTAAEALEHGFIDSIVTPKTKTKNTWNLSAYAKAPAQDVPAVDPAPEPPPQPSMTTANANRLRLATI